MESDDLPLVEVHQRLRQEYGYRTPYVGLWHKAAGGVVPAYQRGSRWYVKASDLPKTAKALGLKPLAPSSPSEG